jgi:anti-sigma regulatory factor (Ser/Thr protein kinase)
VRRLLDKVIGASRKEKQIEFPSLPSDIEFDDLSFRTKRGFLAKKLANYLDLTKEEGDALYFKSLSNESYLASMPVEERFRLLELSEQMLCWQIGNEDIPKKIKELDITNNLKNAMLKAYDINKQKIFSESSVVSDGTKDLITGSHLEDREWSIYRDVIFAATQGKFLLISEHEIEDYCTGDIFCEGYVQTRPDIPMCRNLANESFIKLGINKSTVMSWLLVLSEALTNTIKHAEEGKMILLKDDEQKEYRFVIKDKGPGFPLHALPNATLYAGFSTKKSMGQGFTLMMKIAKKVMLATSPKGSTIILVFEASEEGRITNAENTSK